MEEAFPEGPYLLKSTFRRHKETYIHILRPARGMSENCYEHILDLEPVLKGSSLEVSRFQADNLDSPAEPQPDLRKDVDGLGLLFGLQEHRSRTLHPAPAFGGLPHSPSDECNGLPSWPQTRFKLHRSSSPCPSSPFFSQLGGNACTVRHLPPASNVEDPLRHNDQKRRRSCEYCRFRKKKCSGHSTCILCLRQAIDCVYMPDLIAKRMAECLSHPSLGSRFSNPATSFSTTRSRFSKVHRRDPRNASLASPANPPETLRQRSGRVTTGQERAPNGSAKRQRRPRLGKVPTRSVVPNHDQYSHCADSSVAGLGSEPVELALHLAGGLPDVAGRGVDFWNTEPGCLSFGVLDHSAEPQQLPENAPTTQPPGFAEDEVRISELEHYLDATGEGATRIFGFDISPSTEVRLPLESSKGSFASLTAFPSLVPQSPRPPVPSDIAGDPAVVLAVDDWLAWYDLTLS